jgi:hypothetical protein
VIQLGAQLDWFDAVCLQQRASRIDGADGPAELGQVLAPAPAKLGTVGVIEVPQHSIEQMLGRYGRLALAFSAASS